MRSRRGVQFCESAQVIHAGFPDSENCEALIDLIHEVINHAGIETTHILQPLREPENIPLVDTRQEGMNHTLSDRVGHRSNKIITQRLGPNGKTLAEPGLKITKSLLVN